jgi:prenylcysteine alpha-carboxyl methylesterase
MEGEESFKQFSPEVRLKDLNVRKAAALLPHIILFHGSADYSIPPEASKTFTDALQAAEVKAELVMYKGKTHTDLFLQVSKQPLKIIFYIHSSMLSKHITNCIARIL